MTHQEIHIPPQESDDHEIGNKTIHVDPFIKDILVLTSFYRYSEMVFEHRENYDRIIAEETTLAIEAVIEAGPSVIKDSDKFLDYLNHQIKDTVKNNIDEGLGLLRHQLLVAVHSLLENFLCQVYRVYLYTFPRLLREINREITYRKLLDILDRQQILDFVVDDEVRRFSFKSLAEKKECFKNKLKIYEHDSSWNYKGDEIWKEIDKFRHSIIHGDRKSVHIDTESLMRFIFYVQRLIIAIVSNAQAFQGVTLKWKGFDEYIKKAPEPTLKPYQP